MRFSRSDCWTLVGLVAAGCLHLGFCEWRTLEYAAEEREPANRMLRLRRHFIATGNAEDWDRRDAELDRYHETFLDCHGPPTPEIEACVRQHYGGSDTPTAIAVAIADCEFDHLGAIREAARLTSCLSAAGYDRLQRPRWTSERIGARFAGPYFRETALYAEAHTSSAGLNRTLGWLLGLVLPGGLTLTSGTRFARSRRIS